MVRLAREKATPGLRPPAAMWQRSLAFMQSGPLCPLPCAGRRVEGRRRAGQCWLYMMRPNTETGYAL